MINSQMRKPYIGTVYIRKVQARTTGNKTNNEIVRKNNKNKSV